MTEVLKSHIASMPSKPQKIQVKWSRLSWLVTLKLTHPSFHFGLCRKYWKGSHRVVECDDCAIVHQTWKEGSVRSQIWCWSLVLADCKGNCSLCIAPVLNGHKAVQCDCCEIWKHSECSYITEAQHESLEILKCTWICSECKLFNFSDSFSLAIS